jgi:hypothetical protein
MTTLLEGRQIYAKGKEQLGREYDQAVMHLTAYLVAGMFTAKIAQ